MAEHQYRQLGFKIAMTIIIFCVIPLLLLGTVLYSHFSKQYEQKMMENLRTLAENRRGAINLFFDERISQLVTLANTSSLEQMRNEDFLGKAFEVMQKRSKSFLDLGVIDQEGNHLAYVGPHRNLKEVNYKNEEWFHAVMNTGEYVSDIYLGFRKTPHFIIAVLVRGKTENWILRATINSDILQEIVDAAQVGKTGDAYIINRDNVLQTKPRFGGEVMGKPPGPDFSKTMTIIEEMLPSNGESRHLCRLAHQIKTMGPGHWRGSQRTPGPFAPSQVYRRFARPDRCLVNYWRRGLHHPETDAAINPQRPEKGNQ